MAATTYRQLGRPENLIAKLRTALPDGDSVEFQQSASCNSHLFIVSKDLAPACVQPSGNRNKKFTQTKPELNGAADFSGCRPVVQPRCPSIYLPPKMPAFFLALVSVQVPQSSSGGDFSDHVEPMPFINNFLFTEWTGLKLQSSKLSAITLDSQARLTILNWLFRLPLNLHFALPARAWRLRKNMLD